MTSILAAILLARQAMDVTVPYSSPKGLILAQMTGNDGRPLRVLVDTGAERTVVDSSVAKDLGLKLGTSVRARGSGGTVEARFVKGLQLGELGEVLDAVALPLDALGSAIGTHIDAILGEDVLARRIVEIDGAAGKLTFYVHPPAVSAYDTVLSLHMTRGRPYVMATVVSPEGSLIDAEMLMDSGSDTTAELAQPYADEVGLRTLPDPDGRRILGVGGTVPLRIADLREVRLGSTVVPPKDVRVFYHPADSALDGDGRLGNGFLSRFKATIDGPGLKLILTPLRKA